MTPVRRGATAMAACACLAAVAVGAAACSSDGSGGARPKPVGTLAPGFYPSADPPPPEGTITPEPKSWDGVHPPRGYRVVLVTAGTDAQTKVLVTAIKSWAEVEKVDLTTLVAHDAGNHVPTLLKAIERKPDLIVSAGNDMVDPMAAVTPSYGDQEFLVVGAEIAEPTYNVTAADWQGAAFRGEGLGMASTYDPTSFTPERAGRAIRAGVAAVLSGHTGIVVELD